MSVELLGGGDTAGVDLLLTDLQPGMAAGMLSVHVMTQVPLPSPPIQNIVVARGELEKDAEGLECWTGTKCRNLRSAIWV